MKLSAEADEPDQDHRAAAEAVGQRAVDGRADEVREAERHRDEGVGADLCRGRRLERAHELGQHRAIIL